MKNWHVPLFTYIDVLVMKSKVFQIAVFLSPNSRAQRKTYILVLSQISSNVKIILFFYINPTNFLLTMNFRTLTLTLNLRNTVSFGVIMISYMWSLNVQGVH